MKNRRIFATIMTALISLTVLVSACSPQSGNLEQTLESEQTSGADVGVVSDSSVDAPVSNPVDYYGELLVDGSLIVSEHTGRPTQVTGMSFFWSNWSNRFYSADYVDLMVEDFGCEVVRAAYGINGSKPYSPSDVSIIKSVVEAAIDRGIYVIID